MFAKLTVEEFLDKLGSNSPTPGGGGAAALAAAEAAALLTMVARLTTGKPAFAAIEGQVQEIIAEGDRRRQELMACIDRDAEAFEAVMGAYGMPRATPEEKEARAAALQPALKAATESPVAIARHCASIVSLAADMAEAGNPNTITDAGTAAALAEAALAGAILQARVNLKSIKDEEYVKHAQGEISFLLMTAREGRERAMWAVEKKLG